MFTTSVVRGSTPVDYENLKLIIMHINYVRQETQLPTN